MLTLVVDPLNKAEWYNDGIADAGNKAKDPGPSQMSRGEDNMT